MDWEFNRKPPAALCEQPEAFCFNVIETFDLRQNKTPGAIWHPVLQLNNRRNQTGIRGGENRKN